jgi:GNAT superfamily N-acetyltransferase
MELQDVELREIPSFFNSLGREKDLVRMNLESVMACNFIAGIRNKGELAGLTGIRIQFGFIPNLFIVVKEKYHGMGLANKLLEKNISHARKKYNFLTLTTWERKEYEAALHLYKKHGFKLFYRKGARLRMCISFNRKGDIARKFLPLIYLVLSAFWDLRSALKIASPKLARFFHQRDCL